MIIYLCDSGYTKRNTYFVVRCFAVDWYDWGGDFGDAATWHGRLWRRRRLIMVLGVQSVRRCRIGVMVGVYAIIIVIAIGVVVDVTGVVVDVVVVVCICAGRRRRSATTASWWRRLADVQAIAECDQFRA